METRKMKKRKRRISSMTKRIWTKKTLTKRMI